MVTRPMMRVLTSVWSLTPSIPSSSFTYTDLHGLCRATRNRGDTRQTWLRSVTRLRRPPSLLRCGPVRLGLETALSRGPGRPGRPALDGPLPGLLDQGGKPLQGVLSVLLLCAEPLGRYRQDAVSRDPGAPQPEQPGPDVIGQGRRVSHVEPQPDRGGDLVDVLAARPGRPEELELKLGRIDPHRTKMIAKAISKRQEARGNLVMRYAPCGVRRARGLLQRTDQNAQLRTRSCFLPLRCPFDCHATNRYAMVTF
jgi:hypothetical protein